MKNMKLIASLLTVFSVFAILGTSCKKDNDSSDNQDNKPPEAILKVSPTTGATSTHINVDLSESTDFEDHVSKLTMRIDWNDDGVWDSDWISEKSHLNLYDKEGSYNIQVELKDTQGAVTSVSQTLLITNSVHIVPTQSPFSYNVGINYETWKDGRDNRNIEKDLDTISKYFKLIKTYHTAAVGADKLMIDPTMLPVINYVVSHEADKIELVMGTNNNVLADGGYGKPFTPGLMTTKSYTDEWVQVVINAFGSVANVQKHVKLILLGNEIDINGPAPADSHFEAYYTNWIPQSFDNLKASLSAAGLPDIPVSTTIANYPLSDPTAKKVQYYSVKHIKDNWDLNWNSGNSLVLFNQYTGDSGKSTDFGTVINYFENVEKALNSSPNVYVGETGYTAENGEANEAKVVNQIFSWLGSQYSTNKLTVPLFVFMGFDHPAKPVGQRKMGIFNNDNVSNAPGGIKAGIKIPSWVSKTKN